VPLVLRQWDALARQAEEALAIARENGFPLITNIAKLTLAYRAAHVGAPDVAAFDAALQGAGATGNRGGLAMILWAAAEVHRRSGDPDRALALIGAAFAAANPIGQHHWDAELHRLRGEILAGEKRDVEGGEASFRAALDVARSQGAKMLELRAATSYGRFLRDAKRAAEAKALLGPVYEWFTEGHEFPDLVDAKALLAELG
jgi:tetratricopeptide (TPR) repeat protein